MLHATLESSTTVNRPPHDGVPVPAAALRDLVRTLAERAGMRVEHATLLADLLVSNDLRGVFSHGSRQIATYARDLREGKLNPRPQVRTLNTSGHQLHLRPGMGQIHAAGGSPMSFGIPAGEEPPLVLDFGAIHDLYNISPDRQQYMQEHLPSTLYRSFGLGTVCQALGGFLAGVPVDESRAMRKYPGANQGALFVFVDPARFIDPAQFKREMDEYHRLVRQLEPFAGSDHSTLAGTLEHEREQQWAAEGIPAGSRHREELSAAAAEFGVATPW